MTRREFEVTDNAVIEKILATSKVLHLGLVDEGMPYVVPMNYGYKTEDGKLTLYLHSAVKGYKLDVLAKNNTCCFEMECGVEPFEGSIACQYGISYYCLMGRGKAVIVDDPAEKMAAMTALMKTQTGKDFQFNERLVSIVTVIRIDVSEYTAKHRPSPAQLKEMAEYNFSPVGTIPPGKKLGDDAAHRITSRNCQCAPPPRNTAAYIPPDRHGRHRGRY